MSSCEYCGKDFTYLNGNSLNIKRHLEKCKKDLGKKDKKNIAPITNFFTKTTGTSNLRSLSNVNPYVE